MNTWKQLRSSLYKTAQLLLGQSIVTHLALLALPLYSLQIFDRVLTSSSLETLGMLFIGLIVIGLTGITFEHLRQRALVDLSHYIDQFIFPMVLKNMHHDLAVNKKNAVIEEYNYMQKHLQAGSLLQFFDVMFLPLFVVITALIHPVLGIFSITVNIILLLMAFVKYHCLLPVQFDIAQKRSRQQSNLLSNRSALTWLDMTVNKERWFTDKIKQWHLLEAPMKKQQGLALFIMNLNNIVKWLTQAGFPTIGAVLLLSNEITTGGFIAGLIIGGKAFLPIEGMIANLDVLKKMRQFIYTLKPLLEQETALQSGYQEKMKGHIQLEGVVLSEQSPKAEAHFDLVAKPGDTVAIVGPSGSGQDTIIRQLMGQTCVHAGTVTIDNIRLQDWDKETLGQSIGFISASMQLPETSILSLITSFGKVSESQAIAIAEKTNLNQQMVQCHVQYEDILTIDYQNPSRYQHLKQLIAITAAIALDPAVYVMENPETFLDLNSSNCLISLIKAEQAKGKTIIMSTQSKRLLQMAEMMVLLNQGKTIFQGRPAAHESIQNAVNPCSAITDAQHKPAANESTLHSLKA